MPNMSNGLPRESDSKKQVDRWTKGRHGKALRTIAASLVIATTGSTVFSQIILAPAPAPRYERMPESRLGHIWRRGHWQWRHGDYVWAAGYWAPPTSIPDEEDAPLRESEPAQPPRVERLSADALFPFDRSSVSDITVAGRSELARIAAYLRGNRFRQVEVRGYTDRLGTQGYNQELSQRRADAVKSTLVEEGIPAKKISAIGLGEQDPIVHCLHGESNRLIQCLQPNRRVEIVTYRRLD